MRIEANSTEQMVVICAGLVREGCMFEARESGAGWVIELTGGF